MREKAVQKTKKRYPFGSPNSTVLVGPFQFRTSSFESVQYHKGFFRGHVQYHEGFGTALVTGAVQYHKGFGTAPVTGAVQSK